MPDALQFDALLTGKEKGQQDLISIKKERKWPCLTQRKGGVGISQD